jgi:prophage regulatory protein
MKERLLRLAEVKQRVGLGHSTIYERIARGTFPKSIRDNEGTAVWWLESEIESWIAAKIANSRQKAL